MDRHPAAGPTCARCIQGLEGEGEALPVLSGSQAAPELAPAAPLLLPANLHTPWGTTAGRGRSQRCRLLSQPQHPQSAHPHSPPDPAVVAEQEHEDLFSRVELIFTTYPAVINHSAGMIS